MRGWITLVLASIVLSLVASAHAADRHHVRWVRNKPIIDSIVVDGNYAFSDGDIKKRLYSRTNSIWRAIKGDRRIRVQRETLNRDTLEVKYLYQSEGYLGVRIDHAYEMLVDDKDSTALVRITIDEGRQFSLGEISVTGIDTLRANVKGDLTKVASQLEYGRPVNLFDVLRKEFDMKTILANEGHPYARIKGVFDTISTDFVAQVTFTVRPGPSVIFGNVAIEGLDVFPERAVKRELKIEPDAKYRRKDIIDSRRRLYETGYFSTLVFSRAGESADSLRPDFTLRLRERKPMYVDFETGAAQSKVRDLEWDVSTGFGKRNLLGTRRIDLSADFAFGLGKDARLINNEYRLRFTEPWFLGIRMPMILTGSFQPSLKDPVQDYSIQRWSVSGETIKKFGDEIRTRLGVEYQQVDISGVPEEDIAALREAEGISVRRKAYIEFRSDSRDHIFIPTRGSNIFLSAEYFGGILGGDDSFTRFDLSWSTYQIVWPGWISATRFKGGRAQEFSDSKSVPIDERYFLGGANTVRGFEENSLGPERADGTIGSEAYVLFNQEFRWKTLQVLNPLPVIGDLFRTVPLWQSVFVDVGNGYGSPVEFRFDRLAVAYGTGFQLVSPAGPIRIDYARRIKTDNITVGDRWHFTILYAF